MSIQIDKRRNTYTIQYKIKEKSSTGQTTYRTANITNAKWKVKSSKCPTGVTKKYMQSIEAEEIARDKLARKIREESGQNGFTILTSEAFLSYLENEFLTKKKQTAEGKRYGFEKRIMPLFEVQNDIAIAMQIPKVSRAYTELLAQDISIKRKNRLIGFFCEFVTFCCEREYLSVELSQKIKTIWKKVKTAERYDSENERVHDEADNFWENDEWQQFYNSFTEEEKYWRLLFEVTYVGLLRMGEVRAIKYKDINFENNSVDIVRSIDRHNDLTTTKTLTSSRTIKIPQTTMEKIKQMKQDYYAREEDFLFFADKHYGETLIRRVFTKHIKKANVKHITPHGLKHSGVSRLWNAGVPIGFISKQAGHSDVGITYKYYAHMFKVDETNLVDNVFTF